MLDIIYIEAAIRRFSGKCPGNCKKSYGITSKPGKIYEKYSRRISFLTMLCMLLEQISSTATSCHMDCKKHHQVNLLAIVNVYAGLLLFITVLKNFNSFEYEFILYVDQS